MKKWLLRTALGIVVVAATLAVGGYAYMERPLFGEIPQGERLQRISQSPNFEGGLFKNQIESPLNTSDDSELKMMIDGLFGEKGQPRPRRVIPALKTDLKSLDISQDMVVWLGHSSYYVQLDGKRLLVDPVFSENAAPVPFANVAFKGTTLYSADDMPYIDAILISHDHYDHLDYPTMMAMKSKVGRVIVGLGVGAHFEAWGYPTQQVVEADWYDNVPITNGINVRVWPARHFSGRTYDRDRSLWVGFAVMSSQRRIFFSGDSGYGPHFAEAGEKLGPFDWVALDSGQYDPRWANVHMNPEQAAHAANDLRTRGFSPGHIGRFSLAPHDWDDPFIRVASASQAYSFELWTPLIGRSFFLDDRPQTFSSWWEDAN